MTKPKEKHQSNSIKLKLESLLKITIASEINEEEVIIACSNDGIEVQSALGIGTAFLLISPIDT